MNCKKCLDTGWIVYGPDTETGKEQVKCDCQFYREIRAAREELRKEREKHD